MNRATSVALLVVGRAFPNEIDVFIAIVVFGLAQTVIAVTLGLYWGRVGLAPNPLGLTRRGISRN